MMKRILHIALFALCLSTLWGCRNDVYDEIQKWTVSLDKEDKKPYGAYLSYQSLTSFFPEARIEPLSAKYRFTNIKDDMNYSDGRQNLMILLGLDFKLSEQEWIYLMQFVRNGNELVLFCNQMDPRIQKEFNQKKKIALEEVPFNKDNKLNIGTLRLASDTSKKYGYNGRALQGYFMPYEFISDSSDATSDTSRSYNDNDSTSEPLYIPDTLGYADGKPNILRYSLGSGHITLHAAPLVMSNYFLLQNDNINYLTSFWQMFPHGIGHIYWINYFNRSNQESSLSQLWHNPAARWGLFLSLLAWLCYLLFQMKRRQRKIPIIEPLKNDSATFVETVGRLYFNKGNHHNLSEKMIQQFLEWVRIHYYLNTNLLNDEFVKQLTMKSGKPEVMVSGLVNMIHGIRLGDTKIDDAYLYQLYQTIQKFYKNS